MGQRRRKKFWSYVSGERGRNWVRIFEKTKGGILFIEWYEEVWGQAESVRKRASLGHRDRDEAKKTADELAAAFAKGEEAGTAAHPPWGSDHSRAYRPLPGQGDSLQEQEQTGS